ncbi:hypothetical protein LOC67_17030 [Stieleria sp. JC731]|uniref:hypothetical protein n=1 Tax=Pirellulaceae TaxID=2691357 RepID=UPI001E4224FA|nr:hypothetical protein [Stieleria sp. JC731]MCC9602262.1 hypothetical protein [Stieleria sp. JC731]
MLAPKLQALFDTLDRRVRPEEVAQLVVQAATLSAQERKIISKASSRSNKWSSMTADFARPSNMARQISVARSLFSSPADVDPSDMDAVEDYLRQVDREIGKKFGDNDFKKDRLSRSQRSAKGMDISKRQYNKRFRLAARMERKRLRVIREQLKRSLTLASKSRLASRLDPSHFRDANSACFIAYYVARCNVRSVFTNQSQARPFDEICDMLLKRCHDSESTDWVAIAHVLPDADVLNNVSADDRGRLLGDYFGIMQSAAELLREVWDQSNINRETMVVRRGNDSTTWNVTAGAWNKLRSGWFSLLFSLGLDLWIESMCPGKVLRLMAADVAAWHRASGGDLHADTGPWCDLPLPWEVLRGQPCPKNRVLEICTKWDVDPVKSGWVAPPPDRKVARYAPTPELVHGVEVSSPQLAALLRSLGVFSGKPISGTIENEMLG